MRPSRPSASLLALAFVIAACAPAPQRAQAVAAGDDEALLRAADHEIAEGRADAARAALAGIDVTSLDPLQRTRLALLEAEIALAEDKPVIALQALPSAAELRLSPLAARAEADRANALYRMGDAIGATQVLVARERLMPDEPAREANRDLIWNGLRMSDLDNAGGAHLAQADRLTRGWIELAVISRSVWQDPHALEARLAQWSADYPGHPAAGRVSLSPGGAMAPAPVAGRTGLHSIALLLPLSGGLASAAEAVRDGFFAAYYASAASGAPRPDVQVYDTGNTHDRLQAAWQQALDDGAQFVVGPLTRDEVATLAANGRPAVPVLALNYLDPGKEAPFNFFQWGLAPEDEARQAAERAVADHQFRAVAFVPEGEWGERVLRAFKDRLESLGGAVVAAQTYPASSKDHSDALRALLRLDASEERHRSLTNALGVKSEFEPRRREDIDLIFLGARPEQARQIGPQLRFHRSGDLPIYTTAQIFDGDAPAPDLAGLRFCDMPWMLATDGNWFTLRNELRAQFPRSRDTARLPALGYDAYTLVTLIDSGQLQAGSFFPAASGTLALRADRVISRGLTCGEVRNGAVKPLDMPLTR